MSASVLLIVYDNDSYIHWFPQGVGYLAAVLKNAGFNVTIYNQDYHHYPDSHLTDYLNKNTFDFIGFSFIAGYYQYRKTIAISNAINASDRRPYYVIGGHGPSPEPEYFLKITGADAVVIGEGEETIVDLLTSVIEKKGLETVDGIAYLNAKGQYVINKKRLLIADIDTIPFPAYELFPVHYYRLLRMPHCSNSDFVMPLLSGRGCTFTCNFCYRLDKGFRPRSSQGIIEEIKFLKRNYDITYIAFSDELLMSSLSRIEELCSAFIRSEINIKWDCNGRLNYAKPDILRLMKSAGCVFINYGIEAMDDQVLQKMGKGLSVRQIEKGIKATLDVGISPGFNIIFGHIGDNEKILQKGVDFLLKYDDGAQLRTIRPVTPYPGSPLYYYAIESGLLQGCEDFYENKHLNSDLMSVNFTELSDEEYYKVLAEANSKLLKNYFEKKTALSLSQVNRLYTKKDSLFRGFRQS
ncbi:B12-binding domain-containing radical SAM protein [Chlorobium sp. BLA1]|uniref:B12-binding domain-containing radical SAM protein n=1 Tax=Candidatus Chlorobium masyuteum TaxID=2716876 RepID=UPI0014200AA9|nr:radical SAM protein [Candidatus Chlorobium masyuteum]NHQ59208.1 B12-binding domain-containing radical SAM protein [Candidatus Chlorobium masyuteum]